MKTLTDYTNKAISDLLDKFGAFWAFSNEQFNEKKKEGVTYVNCGMGLVAPKDNANAVVKGLKAISNDGRVKDLAENGRDKVIERELYNYEAFYTGDIQDTVDALASYGITADEVNTVYQRLRETVDA